MFLRVARHTNNIEKIEDFYINILDFECLGRFQNHNNYDGVFIGKSGFFSVIVFVRLIGLYCLNESNPVL